MISVQRKKVRYRTFGFGITVIPKFSEKCPRDDFATRFAGYNELIVRERADCYHVGLEEGIEIFRESPPGILWNLFRELHAM